MGLLDFLLFGAFMNSLRNNNQDNNNPSDYSSRSYDQGYNDGYDDGYMDHDDYHCQATVVTAILIVTISLISNYQPNYIKPMSNGI